MKNYKLKKYKNLMGQNQSKAAIPNIYLNRETGFGGRVIAEGIIVSLSYLLKNIYIYILQMNLIKNRIERKDFSSAKIDPLHISQLLTLSETEI